MQETKRCGFDPWVRKIPWRRKWQQATPVLLPGESQAEEPGGLQSMGSQRIEHDWSDLARSISSRKMLLMIRKKR